MCKWRKELFKNIFLYFVFTAPYRSFSMSDSAHILWNGKKNFNVNFIYFLKLGNTYC